MPRKYISGTRTRANCFYSPQDLETAVEEVKLKKLTLRSAAEKYGVPYTTLQEHVKRKYSKTYSGQTVLSAEEEDRLTKCLTLCGDWGFPMRGRDICNIVHEYLERSGRVEKRFVNWQGLAPGIFAAP